MLTVTVTYYNGRTNTYRSTVEAAPVLLISLTNDIASGHLISYTVEPATN